MDSFGTCTPPTQHGKAHVSGRVRPWSVAGAKDMSDRHLKSHFIFLHSRIESYHTFEEAMTTEVPMESKDEGQEEMEEEMLIDATILDAIMEACQQGHMNAIQSLIGSNGTIYGRYAIQSTGITPLMVAASAGHIDIVQYLLEECSAPWNAVDRNNLCAGDYATRQECWNIVNLLVEWATRAEFILGAIEREQRQAMSPDYSAEGPSQAAESSTKPDYLRQRLQYTDDGQALVDADRDAVMMEWERPIMKAHAELLMTNSSATDPSIQQPLAWKRVLNVGFGMGIIDTLLQEYNPSCHIIIEAHPDVYQHMIQNQWNTKPNVRICFGTWQQLLPQLIAEGNMVDAIFFDTYGEHFLDMEDFHKQMVHLLAKPHGIYSFFNGLAPDNLFFHGVACQCVKLQLATLGLDSEFLTCDIQAPNNDVWKDIRRKYWHGRETYYLPVCTWNAQYLQTGHHPEAVAVLALTEARPKRKLEAEPILKTNDITMETNEDDGMAKRQHASA
jgi:type IV protein arginine methyltransferase